MNKKDERTIQQQIQDALKVHPVVVLPVADETLVTKAALKAAEALAPGTFKVLDTRKKGDLISGGGDFVTDLEDHLKNGNNIAIMGDAFHKYKDDPDFERLIKLFAMQAKNPPYPRLVMLEHPGVKIPVTLQSHIKVIIPPKPPLPEMLKEVDAFIKTNGIELPGNGEVKYALARALLGLWRHTAYRVMADCFVLTGTLTAEWLSDAKTKLVSQETGSVVSFINVDDAPDVGGHDLLMKRLRIVEKVFASKSAADYKLPNPKGIILGGIPGCGKTLFAKYVAKRMKLPLLSIDVGSLFGGIVGQSEANMRQFLQAVVACAPAIVLIDECEKAFAGATGPSGDSGTTQRLFGSFLNFLQENKEPIYFIGTANQMLSLPAEFFRRFDKTYFVDLPTDEEREEIAGIHIKARGRKVEDFDLRAIAGATRNFSGAEIEKALNAGMEEAFCDNGREVTTDDIVNASRDIRPLSVLMGSKLDELRNKVKENAEPSSSKSMLASALNSDGEVRARIDRGQETK